MGHIWDTFGIWFSPGDSFAANFDPELLDLVVCHRLGLWQRVEVGPRPRCGVGVVNSKHGISGNPQTLRSDSCIASVIFLLDAAVKTKND